MFPLDDLLIEIFKHRLVVGYSFADPFVGGMYIQCRAQGLVHHVNYIESSGVLVHIHVQLLITHCFLAAVFMQQFVAVFQCGASQQEASLLLVVIDIGFNRPHIKTPLRICGQGCQQHYQQSEYICPASFHRLPSLVFLFRAFSIQRS